MRLGATIPEEGAIFEWDIAEILERESGDMNRLREVRRCAHCRDESDQYDISHRLRLSSCSAEKHEWHPLPLDELWERMLTQKRRDHQYEGLLQSIPRDGIRRPLNVYLHRTDEGEEVRLCDGHHRFAAAVALELATVPVKFQRAQKYDSWGSSD